MTNQELCAAGVLASCVILLACSDSVPTEKPKAQVARDAFTGGTLRTTLKHYTSGAHAKSEGRLDEAKLHFLEALGTSPEHPALLFEMASIEAMSGDCETSQRWLQRLADLGGTAPVRAHEAFAPCTKDAAFVQVVDRIEANGSAQSPAAIVATIEDAELWPEGIALDRATGDVFLGSMSENKIVVVRAGGLVEDFGSSAGDELWPVLGMTVDEKRRHLWACMGSGSDELITEGERRVNGVVRYDLDSGKLLARYELADDGVNRLLNDVVIASDGTAYITESNHGSVYLVTPGGDTLAHFRHFPGLNYLNGLSLSADERTLYLAAVEGIYAFDLEDEDLQPLAHDSQLSTVSADGLCRLGSNLVAVQNQPKLNFRVMRFELDETGHGIQQAEILATGMPEGLIPYTCAAGADEVYINGTGPLNLMDGDEAPANPVVIRVPL